MDAGRCRTVRGGSGDAGINRPIFAGLTVGARLFAEETDLKAAAAFGGRLGLGLSDRISVYLDALTSSPLRATSGRAAHVTAIRAAIQGRILLGKTFRPYLTFGGGALIFNYGDPYDTVGGVMTVGGGFDLRVAPRTLVFVESSADLYRTVNAVRLYSGEEYHTSSGNTQAASALSLGIAVEF